MKLLLSFAPTLLTALAVADGKSHRGDASLAQVTGKRTLQESQITSDTPVDVQDTYTPTEEQDTAVGSVGINEVIAPSATQLFDTDVVFPPESLAYMEFDDCNCWYMGKVSDFDAVSKTYSVEFDDSDTLSFNIEETLRMTTEAVDLITELGGPPDGRDWPQVFAIGTPAWYRFEDFWYSGKIVDFDADKGEYEVQWSDNSKSYYRGVQGLYQVRTMVSQAAMQVINGPDGLNQVFAVGMSVYFKFPEDGWYEGSITNIDSQTGSITVTWSDDSSDTYTDLGAVQQMVDLAMLFDVDGVRSTEQVFPVDTIVYKKFEDGWYKGKVASFDPAPERGYRINWSDGTVSRYYELDEMVEIVTNAAEAKMDDKISGRIFPAGTLLYYHFKSGWYWGRVSGHEDGHYKTSWSDFSGYYYDDLGMLLQMAVQAANAVGGFKPGKYANGTPVFYKFPKGWWVGRISLVEDGEYTVTWSDGSKTSYDDPLVVKQMVDQYANMVVEQEVPTGAQVYREFKDGGFFGEITDYDEREGEYEVTYSDDTKFYYDDIEEVRQMVDAAKRNAPTRSASNNGRGGLSPGGKAIISIAVIVAVAAAAFFVYRKRNQKTEVPADANLHEVKPSGDMI